jgi:hypothetical protein
MMLWTQRSSEFVSRLGLLFATQQDCGTYICILQSLYFLITCKLFVLEMLVASYEVIYLVSNTQFEVFNIFVIYRY